MPDEIKVGDVVRLKSGGPLMTVNWMEEREMGMVASCTWFDDKHNPHTEVFPVHGLNLVK